MRRIISEIKGSKPGPVLIFIGGLHGNEAPGITALENVFSKISNKNGSYHGKALALRGNLSAINQNKRFIDYDLNRVWNKTKEDTAFINSSEYHETLELSALIEHELQDHASEAFLFDLHTTSAPTIPFIVTKNHKLDFIKKLEVPFVTGLNGYLEGTLLSWFGEKEHCGLAFEAGQHHSTKSIIKHEAFIELSMHHTGFRVLHNSELKWAKDILEDELKPIHNHFKLIERYGIANDEQFKMLPGFTNFQKVHRGEVLANNQRGPIISNRNASIFMPLYQDQGDDGYFLIEPV